MDTNSNISVEREIVSVEILHLDELGYGPQGKHTRREWRAECLENLLAAKDQFLAWQKGWEGLIDNSLTTVDFECKVTYNDGQIEKILDKQFHLLPNCALDIVGHVFTKKLNASGYTFLQIVLFENTVFESETNFFGAIFNKDAYFNSAVFSKIVFFSDALFQGRAEFYKAMFSFGAFFDNTEFRELTLFNKAAFGRAVNFRSATFSGNAEFRSTTFEDDANFLKVKFKNQCRFDIFLNFLTMANKTSFGGKVNFETAVFENVGHFERVQFKDEVPNFLGVDNTKTLLVFSDDAYFNKKDTSEDAVIRLGQLKRLADEQGQTDQALMFNAFELRAKAKQSNAGILFKITTKLYEKVSDFGRSFAKPIFWYGVLICLSAFFAMIYSTYSDSPAASQQVLCRPIEGQPPPLKLPYGRAVVEYAMFRAGGLMDFTDTGKQNNAVNCRLFEEPIEPPLMRAWGIFKGIASIALLFLAALGLRNKYRIK